jgi:5-methylcytosine-specific restriction endonuclease McrA
MAKRQREWAKRARRVLLRELGGKCLDCGNEEESDLEFDHIEPATWDRSKVEFSARISRYRREAKEGKLAVRCRSCNASKRDNNGAQTRMSEVVNGKGEPF